MQQVKFYVKDKETGKRFAMLEQDSCLCNNCYFYEEKDGRCPDALYCIQDTKEERLDYIYKLVD